MADGHKGRERIALAGVIALRAQERFEQLWGVGDERLGVLVYRCDSPDGIFPHVSMAVVQARARGGEKGLDKFGLAEFAEEAKSVAAHVFVRVLEVISNSVARWSVLSGRSSASGASFRPYQTKIISCFSLPLASSFGQIS